MGPLLRSVQLVVAGPGAVQVGVPSGSPLLERLGSPSERLPLEEALALRLGRPVSLAFSVVASSADELAGRRITPETARRDRLRRLTEEEPRLAEVVQEWDLELID